MEVCVDSVESAVNAQQGGAVRIELCSNLVEGGTTPSAGLLHIVKQQVSIPVCVMLRPRGGDFLYSDSEYEVMKKDLQILKDNGADGFVIGILNKAGKIDIDRCQELLDMARSVPVTFHRAIDMTNDIHEALETVISLGCERVLTSGGENTALEGTPVIRKMVEQADGRIVVIPVVPIYSGHQAKVFARARCLLERAGGITERNLRRILDETGAEEFHGSARMTKPSDMEYVNTAVFMGAKYGPSEYCYKVADRDRVKSMISVAREAT